MIIAALLAAALPVTASAATFTGSWGSKGKSTFEKSFEGYGKSSFASDDRWDARDSKKQASLDFGKGKGDSFKDDAKHGGKDWSEKVHGGKLPTDLADATFGHGSKGSWKGWGGKGGNHVPREPDCTPAPVPLPAGFGLIALGIGALGVAKRRRKAA